MSEIPLVSELREKFGEAIIDVNLEAIDEWVEVNPSVLVEVSQYLKEAEGFRFDMCNSITVVDYLETDPKKSAKVDWEPHMEVVYHLSSIATKLTLVLKVKIPRWKNDVEGELPTVPSVAGVWATADWHEREAFDLSGVNFLGHPHLKRILCPDDWEGHPLRKDYEMPLEYHGIRGR